MTRFALVLALAACGSPHAAPADAGATSDATPPDSTGDAVTLDDGGVGSDGSMITTCPGETYPGPAVCGDGHWTWERPLPTGQRLDAIWSFSASDVWTVGGAGTVLHYDGHSWLVEQTPVCDELDGLWGTSATDLWAVGEHGRIVHRTAAGWSVVDSGTCGLLTRVWGTAGGDVWIVGEQGTVLRGGGHPFTRVPFLDATTYLQGLWVASDSDVWVAGGNAISHWNGAAWTTAFTGNFAMESIWGSDAGHLFAGGFAWDADANAVWMFSEATAATPVQAILSGNTTGGLRGTAPNDVWFVESNQAYHYDGAHWNATGTGTFDEFLAVAPTSASDAWAVGQTGVRMHWNGTLWSELAASDSLTGVWASAADDAWLSAGSGLAHWNGATWSAPITSGPFDAVWGTSATDVWGVGYLRVVHWNGTAWSPITVPGSTHWYTAGGSGPNDVWIGGYQGGLVHWNGTAWSAVSTGATASINSLWAFAANDVWAATDEGVLHWNGSIWSIAGPLNVGQTLHVWGSGPHDLYVGGWGALYHYDGNAWSQALVRPNTEYRNVWGTSATDVWVLESGEFGAPNNVLHWDGATWTTHINVASNELVGLGGAGDRVWIADLGGGLRRLVP